MEAKDSSPKQKFAMITVSDSLGLPSPGDSLAAQRAQEAWPNLLKELFHQGGGAPSTGTWALGATALRKLWVSPAEAQAT